MKENTDQKKNLNGERIKAQEAAEKAKAMIRVKFNIHVYNFSVHKALYFR